MPTQKENSNISKTLEILKKYLKDERKTTLNREGKDTKNFTPYQTLISCLLSLRAKDEVTEKISLELFKIASTPEAMLKLSEKELKKIIFSSGHYNKKAEAIRHVSHELIEKFNSKVPQTREELMSIKHIGPKTANIVLCFAFDKEFIPVDIHVHRIPNRLGWLKTSSPEKTEQELMKILPRIYWKDINGLLVLFGKKICVPISPKCSICPISKYCKKVGVSKFR
jgi:endonuclease-3